MRRKKRAGQRGRSKIAIRRPVEFGVSYRRSARLTAYSVRVAEPGDRQPARSLPSRRVFLRRCVGRSDDSRRAGSEIYIDTRVKTIVPLPIAAADNDIDPGEEEEEEEDRNPV